MSDPIIKEDCSRVIASVGDLFQVLGGKTILITGANGFLPSFFIDTLLGLNEGVLLKNPVRIIALTRRLAEKNERLKHCLTDPQVKIFQADVAVPFEIGERIDYVIHAASKASPSDYLRNPIDTIDANVWGTRHLLEFARLNPVTSFLFISSGEIYGSPDEKNVPIREDYNGNVNPIGTRSGYQESKRFGETLCYNFWKVYGIPVKIARPFHTYGPRLLLSDGRVIPEFMRRCFAGEDLEVVRHGSSIRTFSYISDTVDAVWRILLRGTSGEAYNVGSEEEISVQELAKLFVKIFENAVNVEYSDEKRFPDLVATPQITTPDISKIKNDLGYKPHVSFTVGIERLKKWYELYGALYAKQKTK